MESVSKEVRQQNEENVENIVVYIINENAQ